MLFDAISAKIGHAAFVRAVKSNDFKRSISMTVKELGELRRRLRPDKNAISRIYGCYVNSSREIISYLDESLGTMPQDESEKYLSLLKKGLSGGLGRNLIDIVFSTAQVMDSDEHRLLTALRDSELKDAEARNRFYQTVIDSLEMEDCNYLILLACDVYDVPHRSKDDELQPDASDEVFRYILCSICPVKDGKPELGFFSGDNEFHSCMASQIVSQPELGFLFPAFDDRTANIYNALLYTRTPEIRYTMSSSPPFSIRNRPSPQRSSGRASRQPSAAPWMTPSIWKSCRQCMSSSLTKSSSIRRAKTRNR